MLKQIAIAGLLFGQSAPALAAELGPDPAGPARHAAGAFAGAQLRLSLGAESRASAGLALAPMTRSVRGDGQVRLAVGEGLGFVSVGGGAPTFNLAGKPLRQVARAAQDEDGDKEDDDDGISTLGWVGIGVGALVVGAAAGFAVLVSSIEGE